MPTLGKTKVSPSLISTGSLFLGTSSYAVTASYAMNGGSGGSGGSTQTGSIANQTILYNVTTSQDNVISGLNLTGNKWGVTVVEEWNSASVAGDTYYSSCSLLMHFSGSDGSTTFTDNSPNNFTVTSTNGAKITSSISKFGGSSGFFDGTNDYLSLSSDTKFAISTTEDYTVECWVNFRTVQDCAFWQTTNNPSSADGPFWFGYATGKLLSSRHGSGLYEVSATWTPSTGIWYHVSVTRASGTVRLFVDGIVIATNVSTQNGISFTQSGGAVGLLTTPAYFNGYLDELRVTKGVARYTGSFVTQSIDFPNSTGSIQYATKYIGLVGGINDSTVDYGVEKLSDSSLKIRKMTASGQPLSGSGALSASVDRVYVNVLDYTNVMVTSSYALTASYVLGGIQTGSISNQTILYNVTTSQDNTITGLDLSGNKWDVSVIEEWNSGSVIGDDYYNSCSLLMHFSGSNGSTTFVDNSPRTKTFTVNGNSQISTAQSKFGSASLYLDGTGDYLSSPSNADYAFGTGDFTIECWAYRSAGNDNGILQISSTAGGLQANATTNLAIASWNSARLFIQVNNAEYISTAFTNTVNTWNHYALVRSSGVTKLYLNGNLVTDIGTSGAITDTTNYTGTYLAIGGYYSTTYLWNGYIDELRVTKGVARYTTNFATQSAEFFNNASVSQLQTKYVGLVGGLNDSTVDYGVEKLSDTSLKIRKMTASGQPLSGSGALSASVDRVYVNVLNYKEVQTTAQSASYAVTSSYSLNSTGNWTGSNFVSNIATQSIAAFNTSGSPVLVTPTLDNVYLVIQNGIMKWIPIASVAVSILNSTFYENESVVDGLYQAAITSVSFVSSFTSGSI